MRTFARLRSWVRSVAHRSRLEREIDDELHFHVDRYVDDLIRTGVPVAEARRRAGVEFGGIGASKEDIREALGLRLFDEITGDLRYAFRQLRRSPAFTAVAVLSLALGIGATTSVFSVVSAVLLRPLPYPNAARLVRIVENLPAEESRTGRPMRMAAMNQAEFVWWRRNSQTLADMAVTMPETRTMMARDATVRLTGARVSPALFRMRNVQPVLGRWLRPDEERLDVRVVVLSAAMWQRYFAGTPDVVGRDLVLDGQVYSIVGVMPTSFGEQMFWTPYVVEPPSPGTVQVVQVTALLKDGITIEAAATEVTALGARLRGISTARDGAPGRPARFDVVRLIDSEIAAVRPALVMLVVAVGVVLLIVCANVANLLLVRGAKRHREIAIRQALGGGRARLVRQLLTESLVLSLGGAIAGAVLAYAAVHFVRAGAAIDIPDQFRNALGAIGPTILPRAEEAAVDSTVLAFAFALSLLAGVVFGLAPALRLARADYRYQGGSEDLAIRGGHSSRGANRVGHVLAVVQLGLATTLLIGSGLLLRSFINLSTVVLGFDPDAQIFQLVSPGEYSRSRKIALASEMATRLGALPGVEAAGFVNVPPLTGQNVFRNLYLPAAWEAQREFLGEEDRTVIRGVSPDYLRGLGVRLLEGRWLDEQDGPGRRRVMLVNRGWVRRFSPAASPIDTTVTFVTTGREPRRITWEIVGVVEDMRWRMDDGPDRQPGAVDFPLLGFMDLRQLLAESGPNRPLDRPSMELDMLIGEPGGLGRPRKWRSANGRGPA